MSLGTRTFPCPHCGRIINTAMSECRYCMHAIDQATAESAAALHERIHKAGFDSAMLKQAAIWLPVSLLVMFIPIVGIVGLVGYFVLLVCLPLLFIRWWIRYGGLTSTESDYVSSKRRTLIALMIWGLFVVLTIVRFVWLRGGA